MYVEFNHRNQRRQGDTGIEQSSGRSMPSASPSRCRRRRIPEPRSNRSWSVSQAHVGLASRAHKLSPESNANAAYLSGFSFEKSLKIFSLVSSNPSSLHRRTKAGNVWSSQGSLSRSTQHEAVWMIAGMLQRRRWDKELDGFSGLRPRIGVC